MSMLTLERTVEERQVTHREEISRASLEASAFLLVNAIHPGYVQKWPIGGSAVVKNFELDRLLQSEPDQYEVARAIQDEVVIMIRHYSLKGECDEWVNQLSILS
jgi:hypothetical protein